jgi:hypothetical protein
VFGIHDILQATPDIKVQSILWDMRQSSRHAKFYSVDGGPSDIPISVQNALAIMPNSPQIVIMCPSLPWKVTIAARDGTSGRVTVQQVLDALYDHFCTVVTAAELQSICAGRVDIWQAIDTARSEREQLLRSQPNVSSTYGCETVLRVDILLKGCMFSGLKPIANGVGFLLETTCLPCVK